MNGETPAAGPEDGATAAAESGVAAELAGGIEAGREIFALAIRTGTELSSLAALEIRLALDSALRMMALAVVFVFLAALAWVGLSLLLGWLVLDATQSGAAALAAFTLWQFAGLAAARVAWRRYQRALSLPDTRAELDELAQVLSRGDWREA